ncbi:TetR family transcriptional regulator [Saccharothrix saharensis]|uniref:TetR family transcriptional regulator n=2 Tax=Saccharothrix saharensis TaxID=571190 RepID=A0A543J4R8_9PSEU|nr:TetR family transcriptional regulator [Saccharothrix saharensis]
MAALRALARGGVAAVPVDALAGEPDITRGSVHWHFEDREALLVAAVELREQRTTADLIARLAVLEDPEEKLREGLRTALGPEVIAGPAYLGWAELRRVATAAVPEVSGEGQRGRAALQHLIDRLTSVG